MASTGLAMPKSRCNARCVTRPAVTIVKVGQACDILEQSCKALGMPLNVFEFRGDYYALPNVIPLLSMPSQAELLMEILSYPLPERKAG